LIRCRYIKTLSICYDINSNDFIGNNLTTYFKTEYHCGEAIVNNEARIVKQMFKIQNKVGSVCWAFEK